MSEQKQAQSRYIAKINAISQAIIKLVEKDSKKSLIIIATDSSDDKGTEVCITMAGKGSELAYAISELSRNEQSHDVFIAGILKANETRMDDIKATLLQTLSEVNINK